MNKTKRKFIYVRYNRCGLKLWGSVVSARCWSTNLRQLRIKILILDKWNPGVRPFLNRALNNWVQLDPFIFRPGPLEHSTQPRSQGPWEVKRGDPGNEVALNPLWEHHQWSARKSTWWCRVIYRARLGSLSYNSQMPMQAKQPLFLGLNKIPLQEKSEKFWMSWKTNFWNYKGALLVLWKTYGTS